MALKKFIFPTFYAACLYLIAKALERDEEYLKGLCDIQACLTCLVCLLLMYSSGWKLVVLVVVP